MVNLREFIIPAIDLKDGKVVRLEKGDFSKVKKYKDDPSSVAQLFDSVGFKRLHIVDLDGAKSGKPVNSEAIKRIRKNFSGEIELGGGLRTCEQISFYKDIGIDYFVLGTIAITDADIFERMVYKFEDKIILAIDSKGGKVAVSGWQTSSDLKPYDLVKRYDNLPLWGYLYTIVERDGTLGGVDVEPYRVIRSMTSKPIIASGGVSSLEDVKKLSDIVDFVVVGKAIYEGLIDL